MLSNVWNQGQHLILGATVSMKVKDGLIGVKIGTGEDESGNFFIISVFEFDVVPDDCGIIDDSFFGSV